MSVNSVLSKILKGNNNFCYLCYQDANENAVSFDEEIYIDDCQNPERFSEILHSVLGEMYCELSSSIGVICSSCSVSLANIYKFQTTCKDNIKNLVRAIDSIKESFENVALDHSHYKSLVVSLNVNDFTSTQFYDVKRISDKKEPVAEFHSTRRNYMTGKQETKRILPCDTNARVQKENIKAPKIYDIPTIPTLELVYDRNNPDDFKCSCCLMSFTDSRKLRNHYFKKHYPRQVKCKKCNRSFISKEHLKLHEKEQHTVGVCSECGKHFTNKYILQKHESNHNTQIVCQDCGRVYRSKEAFKKHITDDVCRQKTKKSSKEGIYQCDTCKKTYCYKPYLAKHIKYEHGNAQGFICTYCNKQFYTQSKLQSHVLKHTKVKNFVCNICNGRFVTRETLIYHTRLHTGERPYQCEYCEKAFLSASRRLDHVRRHHLAPSLECEICHSKFKAATSLRKHRIRHFNPQSRLYKDPNQECCRSSN